MSLNPVRSGELLRIRIPTALLNRGLDVDLRIWFEGNSNPLLKESKLYRCGAQSRSLHLIDAELIIYD